MRQLFFIAAVFTAALCTSCGSNNAGVAGNSAGITSVNSTSSNGAGEAIFSYNLEGTKVSGGEADALQINNTAWVTKSGSNDKLQFFLGDAYQESTETFSHSLRFTIPDKKGAIALTTDEDTWNVQLFLGNSQNDKYVMYANEDFSINVTNVSATRVSGTFSGHLKIIDGTGAGKSALTVTDGKFDIPVKRDAH